MCVIVDADVAQDVFGHNRTSAGEELFKWLNAGRGHLLIGGRRLRGELNSHEFKEWAKQASRRGILVSVEDESVDNKADKLRREQTCESNDQHIIALAQIGRAHLLYSKDQSLHKDFKNSNLIKRGKIYPGGEISRNHKELLRKTKCPAVR